MRNRCVDQAANRVADIGETLKNKSENSEKNVCANARTRRVLILFALCNCVLYFVGIDRAFHAVRSRFKLRVVAIHSSKRCEDFVWLVA